MSSPAYRANYGLIDWSKTPALPSRGERRVVRSSLACPMVIADGMAPVQSMLDGRMYDSKAALRATYRAAGVVEVGNDPARLRPRARAKPDRSKIKEAVEKASARWERGERS